MIQWMKPKPASALEPWWIPVAPLTALFIVGIHSRFPSVVPSPMFGLALDAAFLLTAGMILWRGRERPLASLFTTAMTLAGIGMTVAGILSLSPDHRGAGVILAATMVNIGFVASGLCWLVIQTPRQLALKPS